MVDQSRDQGSLRQNTSDARRKTRLWLSRLLKLMGWAMLLGFIYWCLAGLGSDQQTKVARYQLNVSDIEEGQSHTFSIGKQPIIVVHRDQAQLQSLSDIGLNDASSWQNNEPSGVDPVHRGTQAAWIVLEALGTELNCPVQALPAGGEFQGRSWLGGFVDRCRGNRYDWAGRVYAEQGAKRNLRVMSYRLRSGPRLAIELQ